VEEGVIHPVIGIVGRLVVAVAIPDIVLVKRETALEEKTLGEVEPAVEENTGKGESPEVPFVHSQVGETRG
jgi:hypothetical protein